MSTIITSGGNDDTIESLKTCTKMLMNHVHYVQQDFNLIPAKKHFGTCINYIDLQEYREEFCEELVNTVSEWVYNQKKATAIMDKLLMEGRSGLNAQSMFINHTFKKFRDRDKRALFLQGQFGELLLFNFLQHFFGAVPLLRKMPITTSNKLERFGADAIHYVQKAPKNLFYLGEAKTYTNEYGFAKAFQDALNSVLKTYKDHRKEIKSYIYDDFIDDNLIDIATAYKNGTIQNTEIHLVSIIVYNETKSIIKMSEVQIKADIMRVIEGRTKTLNPAIFNAIDKSLHPRFNYIILPIWELDQLMEEFQKYLRK